MKFTYPSSVALVSLGSLLFASAIEAAPTLQKIHDIFVPPGDPNDPGYEPPPGAKNPYDGAILVGENLWFTSYSGGTTDPGGTLTTYNLTSGEQKVRVSLNNGPNGMRPTGAPLQVGNLIYYTTLQGGSGGRGVVSVYDTTTGVNSVIWNAPSDTQPSDPGSIPGNVTVIDRGEGQGRDIYLLTSAGGAGSAYGTIVRLHTADATPSVLESMTVIKSFLLTTDPRQPFKGFTAVGKKLYFTTFTGGNGYGTLNELDATVSGGEVHQMLAAMPSDNISVRYPSHNPYYRASDNSLYFGTAGGNNVEVGAIMKFDLTTRILSVVYEIPNAASTSGPYPFGNKVYSGLTEWNRELYFCTSSGGSSNGGTINRIKLDTGAHEVLFNLSTTTGATTGGNFRGRFCYNESVTEPAFYIFGRTGGVNGLGTIMKLGVDLPIDPTSYEVWKNLYPGFTGETSVPNADADHDGLTNKVEFAFGTAPDNSGDTTVSSIASSEAGVEIRWSARTDEKVTYKVTTSPTLGQAPSPWTEVAQTPAAMPVPDIVPPAGYERRHVVIPASEAAGFFRVEATFQPGAAP